MRLNVFTQNAHCILICTSIFHHQINWTNWQRIDRIFCKLQYDNLVSILIKQHLKGKTVWQMTRRHFLKQKLLAHDRAIKLCACFILGNKFESLNQQYSDIYYLKIVYCLLVIAHAISLHSYSVFSASFKAEILKLWIVNGRRV